MDPTPLLPPIFRALRVCGGGCRGFFGSLFYIKVKGVFSCNVMSLT